VFRTITQTQRYFALTKRIMDTTTELTPLTATDYQLYFDIGIDYPEYNARMSDDLVNGKHKMNAQYVPLNMQRMNRLDKTVVLNPAATQALDAIKSPLKWLVISEHWCGDASQILPVLNAFAKASNGLIELRIVYRDENLNLIDHHLTRGGRSIPKLIQLDSAYNINATWGPRPAEAQALVIALKANPETAPTYGEQLHKWYAEDKTLAIQHEIANMLLA
jgi:hypothetical protein